MPHRKIAQLHAPRLPALFLNGLEGVLWAIWMFQDLNWYRVAGAFVLIFALTKVVVAWHEVCHVNALRRNGVPRANIVDDKWRLVEPQVSVRGYLLTRAQMLEDLEAPTAPPLYPMLLMAGIGGVCTLGGWWLAGFRSWVTLVGLVLLPMPFYSIGDIMQRRAVLKCEPTDWFEDRGDALDVYRTQDEDNDSDDDGNNRSGSPV